ncbi:MAG: IS1 family transposase [Chloroflexi bacterium]|nr:IS1 family transposase [Chloroflexota bacterium]
MSLLKRRCPACAGENFRPHTTYTVQNGEQRQIYCCLDCGEYFSQTKNTPIENLRTPLSFIQLVLDALNNGLGINAACATFHVSKNSIYLWQARLAGLKEVLLVYALCQQFLEQLIEGDELYTKVEKNKPPMDSEGWTIVLMDRASRFLWELSCGEKEHSLFEQAMKTLAQVVEQTADLTLLTDGERRYGNLLFEICREVVHTGRSGRPKNTLPKGVKVRVKNKGSQAHKRGPKRPKYQTPHNEHPETVQNVANEDIHANHLEAFNSALRRKLARYRCRTNTYAKKQPAFASLLLKPASQGR